MDAIDPVQYGKLLASVEHLEKNQTEMKASMAAMAGQIEKLLELANKSKGGLWVGMSLAAGMGSFATWFLKELFGGKP